MKIEIKRLTDALQNDKQWIVFDDNIGGGGWAPTFYSKNQALEHAMGILGRWMQRPELDDLNSVIDDIHSFAVSDKVDIDVGYEILELIKRVRPNV